MGNTWEWIQRLDAGTSLFQKLLLVVFGSSGMTALGQAILVMINLPNPPWWIPAGFAGVCAAGIGLVLLRGKYGLRPKSINPEVKKQMDGLSPFAQMAIKHLVTKRGMTESYFSQLVMDMGFPVVTLQQQNAVGNVLSELASNTTLLTKDPQSVQWVVKPEFIVSVIGYLSMIEG